MRYTILAILLTLAAPTSAQLRYDFMPGANSADHTRRVQADPNFGGAVVPNLAPAVVYQAPPAPAPPPAVRQAMWTYNGLITYDTCNHLPAPNNVYCQATGSASCSGADCPVSYCMFACAYDWTRNEGCGRPGEQSNLSPSERGMQGRLPYGGCYD